MSATIDRDALRGLCEGAAPAPWTADFQSDKTLRDGRGVVAMRFCNYPTGKRFPPDSADQSIRNRRFIAAAREAVPALLDELDAAEKERDHLADLLAQITRGDPFVRGVAGRRAEAYLDARNREVDRG